MKIFRSASVLALAVAALSAHAVTIFDQFGGTTGTLLGTGDVTSQDFETAYDVYDAIAIDDFTTTASYKLTSFVFGLDASSATFPGAAITGYRVSIYSASAASTSASLVGDVASFVVAPAAATLTPGTSLAGASSYAKVSLDLTAQNFTLAAGTYYIGVTTSLNFGTSGQVYNSQSTAGSTNARFINPGNGFGAGTNSLVSSVQTPGSMAYQLNANPVPEPSAFAALGLGAVAVLRRRAKKA